MPNKQAGYPACSNMEKQMKQIRIFLITLLLLAFALPVWAASVTGEKRIKRLGPDLYEITLRCLGNIDDTIINPPGLQDMGLYLYRVIIENKSTWGTVTDNSDVYIKDSMTTDLLNGQGVDQLDDDTRNYIRVNRKDPIISTLIIDVDNQAEADGVYEIKIILAR
ncbi:MAG: hypothetical protein JRI28_07150 [Deltaproteobacteria bacterium]|nr:hypothetical protein [Deltaproteobacteria bacterium]